MIYVLDRVENIVKRRKCIFPFPTRFSTALFLRVISYWNQWQKKKFNLLKSLKEKKKTLEFPFLNRPSLYLWHFYLWHFYLWYFYHFGSDIFTSGNFTSGIFTAHRWND